MDMNESIHCRYNSCLPNQLNTNLLSSLTHNKFQSKEMIKVESK